MIQKVFQLQEEREHSLKIFEEGYKIYMTNQSNCNLTKFRQLVTDVTKDFKRISTGMIDVAKYFRHNERDDLAKLIMSLQEEEENRLQLSAKLQMAKKEATDNRDAVPNLWNKVAHLKELYNNSIQMVNECVENLRTETDKISY
ncbi:DNA repair REX1-B-like protein [Euroglyphus maynei]|uniref:DNA repair REX1-B-like protein n=1 Tax=Euroglyphus maynei TaxID=6958 RepID=A0A1Y3BS80_EURMA|nr:DNA repair REX1-B-like protein [Euroglyphus maynei]